MEKRHFGDRDYIETKDGLFFCVVGNTHPPDRVFAYLKYAPTPAGKWGKGSKRYARTLEYYTIPALLNTIDLLEKRFPQYVYYSPVFQVRMSAVPKNYIRRRFYPERKLSQLLRVQKPDSLQKRAIMIASLISRESGVSLKFFGITGSILIDLHQPEFSDVDLLIYGRENSLKIKDAMLNLFEASDTPIKRLTGKTLEEWCVSKIGRFPLTLNEAKALYMRKWNRGTYDGVQFSIHPVRLESEKSETYGERIYKPKGIITIRAKVLNTSEALFLPCTYKVEDVITSSGPTVGDIREICTYEGLYADIAEVGDEIIVHGKLEEVHDRTRDEIYHRILVGSPEAYGLDYIKPTSILDEK
ncbi:MAG: hypothetical protein QXW18_06250 [Candidatus Bathyarchaeia archaeon]